MGDALWGGDDYAHKGIVNSSGESFSETDFAGLQQVAAKGRQEGSTAFFNWLTGGGLPKKVDVDKIFAEHQARAAVEERASVGAGVNGLFGFGNVVGSALPTLPTTPAAPSLVPGVPYSVPAVPKLGGKK